MTETVVAPTPRRPLPGTVAEVDGRHRPLHPRPRPSDSGSRCRRPTPKTPPDHRRRRLDQLSRNPRPATDRRARRFRRHRLPRSTRATGRVPVHGRPGEKHPQQLAGLGRRSRPAMWCSSDQGEAAGHAPSWLAPTPPLPDRPSGESGRRDRHRRACWAQPRRRPCQRWHRSASGSNSLTRRQVGPMGGHSNQARELHFRGDRCYTTRRDTIGTQEIFQHQGFPFPGSGRPMRRLRFFRPRWTLALVAPGVMSRRAAMSAKSSSAR